MAVTTSRKILVIDDEQPIVDLISDILSRIDCEPITATKWVDAVEVIVQDEPDLIFLDLKMPTIDGAALLEFIRKQGLQVPVVVVSGYVTEDAERRLNDLGVSGVIRKPFQVKQITDTIQNILGNGTPAEPGEAKIPKEIAEAPSDSTSPRTTDALYEAPLQKAPEPGQSPDSTPQPAQGVGIDALYTLPKNEPPPSGTVRNAPPSSDEVLEALKQSAKPRPVPVPQPAPEQAPEPPAAVQPPQQPAKPQPANEGQAPSPPATPERSLEESLGTRQGVLPTAEAERSHHSQGHHRKRSRSSRSSRRQTAMFMGIITVVCILVAGFLTAMSYYASQVDLEKLKANAARSAVKEVTKDALKEKLIKELAR